MLLLTQILCVFVFVWKISKKLEEKRNFLNVLFFRTFWKNHQFSKNSFQNSKKVSLDRIFWLDRCSLGFHLELTWFEFLLNQTCSKLAKFDVFFWQNCVTRTFYTWYFEPKISIFSPKNTENKPKKQEKENLKREKPRNKEIIKSFIFIHWISPIFKEEREHS